MKNQTFVLASGNKGKIAELRILLSPNEVIPITDIAPDFDPEETGETFRENALIKARAALEISGKPSIADDSGLCVDALGGAPGVHSARYSYPGDRRAKLLRELNGIADRSAKFVCSIVCAFPNGDIIEGYGECRGEIAEASRGIGGFGYDSVFLQPERNLTFAEISGEEKNSISHRGIAIRELIKNLEKYNA